MPCTILNLDFSYAFFLITIWWKGGLVATSCDPVVTHYGTFYLVCNSIAIKHWTITLIYKNKSVCSVTGLVGIQTVYSSLYAKVTCTSHRNNTIATTPYCSRQTLIHWYQDTKRGNSNSRAMVFENETHVATSRCQAVNMSWHITVLFT